jgi:uncharacterized repeat protein (TIGR01451 family)
VVDVSDLVNFVEPGSFFTNTVHVSNLGPSDAQAVMMTGTLQAGVIILAFAGIVLGGLGNQRTVIVMPTTNTTGVTLITILVSDGYHSRYEKFQVTVEELFPPPKTSLYLPLIQR